VHYGKTMGVLASAFGSVGEVLSVTSVTGCELATGGGTRLLRLLAAKRESCFHRVPHNSRRDIQVESNEKLRARGLLCQVSIRKEK